MHQDDRDEARGLRFDEERSQLIAREAFVAVLPFVEAKEQVRDRETTQLLQAPAKDEERKYGHENANEEEPVYEDLPRHQVLLDAESDVTFHPN